MPALVRTKDKSCPLLGFGVRQQTRLPTTGLDARVPERLSVALELMNGAACRPNYRAGSKSTSFSGPAIFSERSQLPDFSSTTITSEGSRYRAGCHRWDPPANRGVGVGACRGWHGHPPRTFPFLRINGRLALSAQGHACLILAARQTSKIGKSFPNSVRRLLI